MSLYSQRDYKRELENAPADEPKAGDSRSAFRRDYARLIHSPSFRRLRGKTQLFHYTDSDFYRTRLTHSLEVAQIATGIASNFTDAHQKDLGGAIDCDLVATAALAHDIGHPPFGHTGEEALDSNMKASGRFEGNAQSLRILTRLEKKISSSADDPNSGSVGLNLTFRTLAAILKYDEELKEDDDSKNVKKGYYASEHPLVESIKTTVRQGRVHPEKFRTLECSIMDISDDISYSTYDIEDAFKSGFLSPVSMISAPIDIVEKVAERLAGKDGKLGSIEKEYGNAYPRTFTGQDVLQTLTNIFIDIFGEDMPAITSLRGLGPSEIADPRRRAPIVASIVNAVGRSSAHSASNGYFRTKFTSDLVNRFVTSVKLQPTKNAAGRECHPAFWEAKMEIEAFKEMEVLKNFVRVSLIEAPVFRIFDYRGKNMVTEIFEALDSDGGYKLLPDDFRNSFEKVQTQKAKKRRLICDFIAGMTDDFVAEFHRRLYGPDMVSMHRPLQYE